MNCDLYHFAVYCILKDYSDVDHPLSAKEIQYKLEEIYNINMGRKKLYRAIHALEDIMDISTFTENRKGYYLIERQLDKSQVLHLCHSVHSTNALTPLQIQELENKLLSLLSLNQKNEFRSSVYLDNPKNNGCQEWLFNMDLLSEAIQKNQWVQFDYCHFNIEKKLTNRTEPYLREPRFIVFENTYSYLIATDDHHKSATHFRIDRIKNLKMINREITTFFHKKDAYSYTASKLFMFSDKSIKAEFNCKYKENIFDIMIDEFGKNVKFTPLENDSEHFKMTVYASYSGLVLFSQKYMDILYPLSPKELVTEITTRLQNTLELLYVL